MSTCEEQGLNIDGQMIDVLMMQVECRCSGMAETPALTDQRNRPVFEVEFEFYLL